MDKVFEQKIVIADITPTKNYSRLCDRPNSLNTFSSDLDEYDDKISDQFTFTEAREVKPYNLFLIEFICPEKRKKKVKYFYNSGRINEKIELQTPSKKKSRFFTSNERHIVQQYGNPFTRIEIDVYSRTIYKSDDKIMVKTYHKGKLRSFNWKFFKITETSNTLTINLKTGNINYINYCSNVVKEKLRFRTNNFNAIGNFLRSSGFIFSKKNDSLGTERDNFLKTFNDEVFVTTLCNLVAQNKDHGVSVDNVDGVYDLLLKNFIDKRGIKVPNDYRFLLENFYPNIRLIRKNDNKLNQAILDMLDIKCKSTIKLLHEVPELNLVKLTHICQLFGDDFYHYINKIPIACFTINGKVANKYSLDRRFKDGYYQMTKAEKTNMLNVLIDKIRINESKDRNTFEGNPEMTILDHLNMIIRLRKYIPTTSFTSTDSTDFNREHARLATEISKIKKGWTIEYQFEQNMIDDVESEIIALKDILGFDLINLKPYILKREEDYNEEGLHMHHCVASYANSSKSIIISLRTLDGQDRITCEFNIQTGRAIQKRHFQNKNPPEHFLDGLLVLEEKVEKYARWGMLNWKEKKKVPLKINGVEVVIENTEPRRFQYDFVAPIDLEFDL
jgi:hypothetical protein